MTSPFEQITGVVARVRANEDTWLGDAEEAARFTIDRQRCRGYLESFAWCRKAEEVLLAYGVASIVSLFLVRIDAAQPNVDEWLWCVVGDVPSAYFVLDEANTAADALRAYTSLMQDWATGVLDDDDSEAFFRRYFGNALSRVQAAPGYDAHPESASRGAHVWCACFGLPARQGRRSRAAP